MICDLLSRPFKVTRGGTAWQQTGPHGYAGFALLQDRRRACSAARGQCLAVRRHLSRLHLQPAVLGRLWMRRHRRLLAVRCWPVVGGRHACLQRLHLSERHGICSRCFHHERFLRRVSSGPAVGWRGERLHRVPRGSNRAEGWSALQGVPHGQGLVPRYRVCAVHSGALRRPRRSLHCMRERKIRARHHRRRVQGLPRGQVHRRERRCDLQPLRLPTGKGVSGGRDTGRIRVPRVLFWGGRA